MLLEARQYHQSRDRVVLHQVRLQAVKDGYE